MTLQEEAAEVVFRIYGITGDREEMKKAAAKLEVAFADREFNKSLVPDAEGRVSTWLWRPGDGIVRRTVYR